MSKTKWYAKPIYALLALALVLSLGIMAVPMAGTVEASGTPPMFTFSGGSLTADLGPWGGTGYVYPPTFDVTASGGIDITFYDVDGSLLKNDNGTTPWYDALKGVGIPGVTAGTSITSIDPDNNSVFWIMVNLNEPSNNDWDGNPISTLGPDETCFTSDDTHHWGFQDWYRPATGGKISGAGEDPYYNVESYVTPNDRFTTAPAHDASYYNTFDLRIKITHSGGSNYNYEMWVRMHNCASVVEGCPYCACGVYNHAINNCGPDDAWRQLASGTTVFPISDIDLSAVHPFVGLGNYPVPATHTLTWGDVVVTGTPTPQAEVWVDDNWDGLPNGTEVTLPGGGIGYIGYDAFATIQDGIDVVAGSTVHVAAGTYSEHIIIDKSNLNLIGEDKETTIIDATQDSSWVVAKAGILIGEYPLVDGVHGVTVSGFTIRDAAMQEGGVPYEGAKYGVGPGGLTGIQIYNSGSNTIENNILINNYWQIWLVAEWPAAGYTECKNNCIANNIIHNSENDGVYLYSDGGVYVENTEIVNNDISNLYGTYASGVEFWGWPEGGLTPTISGTVISGNHITSCTYGVRIRDDVSDITGTLVNFNNFVSNTNYGIYNGVASTIDATNNWWGDPSGPSTSPGNGDKVSANVDYDPWLGAELELPAVHHESLGAGADQVVNASDEADTIVTLTTTGDTEIYIARYESQPFPDEEFPDEALEKYIDIHVSNPDAVEWPIHVEVTYTDAEVTAAGVDESTLGLYYYEEIDTFHRCSDTGANMMENFIWANVTREEAGYPVGTAFGAGSPPPPPPPVGGEVYPVNKLAILAPWIALAMAIIAGSLIVMRRRRAQG